MNPIIEAMARAMIEWNCGGDLPPEAHLSEEFLRYNRWLARVALSALRDCEITGAMVISWEKGDTAQEDWHNMIGAILEEI